MALSDSTFQRLQELLIDDEEYKAKPYQDTEGNWTVGIGWCLSKTTMSLAVAKMQCCETVVAFENELTKRIPFFSSLDEVRKSVLINMSYQMGVHGILQFTKTLRFISLKKYNEASLEMLDSDWGKKYTTRAKRLAQMMRTGLWQKT